MGILSALKERLAQVLRQRAEGIDVAVDQSERAVYQALLRPLACVSAQGLTLSEAGLGSRAGGGIGRRAEAEIRLEIFCQEEAGPGRCQEVFERLCDALLEEGEENLREIRCGAVSYLTKREAFRLEAVLRFGLLLVEEDGEQEVSGFTLSAAPVGAEG